MSRMHWMLLCGLIAVAGCGDAQTTDVDGSDASAVETPNTAEPAGADETEDTTDVEVPDEAAVPDADADLPSSPPPLIVPAETESTDVPAAPVETENPDEKPAETEVIEE